MRLVHVVWCGVVCVCVGGGGGGGPELAKKKHQAHTPRGGGVFE
jgi:hypothetical protein